MKTGKPYIHRIEKKRITEKVCSNIMNSVKLLNRIDIIFVNSENSKISDTHRQLLNLSDKINLNGCGKYVALSNLRIYYP